MNNIFSNLHTHTTFSDGLSTMEEYVKAALNQELSSLGFSDHAYAPYDPDCCMKQEDAAAYIRAVQQLKEANEGRLEIYLGIEYDYYHPFPKDGMDYVIGSVHYLYDEDVDEYYCIDYLTDTFVKALRYLAGGVMQKLIRLYYGAVTDMVVTQKPDIVGHMDLITKLNKGNCYFNPEEAWYHKITGEAVDAIARTGSIVEVNTGAIARGYTKKPYPSLDILRQLRAAGVPVTISSDCHHVKHLTAGFDQAEALIREAGYTSTVQLLEGSFREVPL